MEEIYNINCNYTIDKTDQIIQLGTNWDCFAKDNQAEDNCQSELVLNKSLWDFIKGRETKYFYESILKRLREIKKPITICHRCDSPSKRRFMGLDILPKNSDEIYFNSYVLGLEDREPVKLLSRDKNRSQEYVRMCSNCKKVFFIKK